MSRTKQIPSWVYLIGAFVFLLLLGIAGEDQYQTELAIEKKKMELEAYRDANR